MKLEKLTLEQESKMQEVKSFWLDYIFSCKNTINKQECKLGVDFIYKLADKKSPVVVYVDSPIGCQIAVTYLKEFAKQNFLKKDSVRDSVGDSVWASKIEYNSTAAYGSIGDYGWVSFIDFFTQIGVVNHEKFNEFRKLILSGVYDMIQLEEFCIVSNLPDKIKRDGRGRLHCEESSAIHFRDGFEIFYWHGTEVKKHWIDDKKSITKKEILSEENAEKRRCLREILGAKEYYNIISDGKGVTLLDEDTDKQGFPMRLYETSINDALINKKVQFLECVCPSTERVYNIYTPSQKATNVWAAKADTFGKKQKEFAPEIES